ncbi:MAG: FAD/NAD(P)-binding oxidoreductase, partial [Pseudomonadota bacterium]
MTALVVGAGPAGAEAAIALAKAGLAVTVLDEGPAAGGQVWRKPATGKGPGDALRDRLAASGARHRCGVRVWNVARCDTGWAVDLIDGDTPERLSAPALILCPGARETTRPVSGWTQPGVLSLAGATALLKSAGAPPPVPVLIAGAGPLAIYAAAEILRLGGQVAALVLAERWSAWLREIAPMAGQPRLMATGTGWLAKIAANRVPIHWGASVERIDGDGNGLQARIGNGRTIQAKTICLGGPLQPETEPSALAGVPLRHDPALGGWVPETELDGTTALPGLWVAGDGAGVRGAAAASLQGRIAGLIAARYLGVPVPEVGLANLRRAHAKAARFGAASMRLAASQPLTYAAPDTVICRCEGIDRATVEAALDDG